MQRKRDKQTKNRPPQSVGLPYCSDAFVAITFFVCVVPSDPKTNAGDTIVFFCPFVFSFLFLFLFVFVHKHHAGLEGVACGFLSDIPIILHVSRMGIPCTVSTLEFSNNIAGTCVCVCLVVFPIQHRKDEHFVLFWNRYPAQMVRPSLVVLLR